MMRSLILFLALAVLLCGCENLRPSAERQSFLLQVERLGTGREPRAGTLRMGTVAVASPFGERALVYRRSDVRFETDFYHQFAADPAEMVAEAAAGWLRQGGLFRRVVAGVAATPAEFRLDAGISALYVDFRADGAAAVLDIHWQLVREGDGSPVLDLHSRERVPLAERSPAGAARAHREALRRALTNLEEALARNRFN